MKKVTHVVAGVAVKDGSVFLARRCANDTLGGMWEFPGGKTEKGESPAEALAREFLEEFGATIRVGDHLGDSVYEYPHGSICLSAYRIEFASPITEIRAHDKIAWVSLGELPTYPLAPADDFIMRYLIDNRIIK